jgi:tight adherence protein B
MIDAAALAAGLLAGAAVALASGPDSWSRLRLCLAAPGPGDRMNHFVARAAAGRRWVGLPGRGRAAAGADRRVREPVPVPVVIDLVAAVVEAGAAPRGAIRLVSRCLEDAGDPAGAALVSAAAQIDPAVGAAARVLAGPAADHPPDSSAGAWRPLFAALELAERCGLGPVGLLRSTAGEQRRRRAEALAVAARRLAVLAVLPTTLCLLPGFVVLTVVPLVLDLLPAG